ncbi:hypothetical protein ABZ769_30330 [Streptomyces olivoreticuli]
MAQKWKNQRDNWEKSIHPFAMDYWGTEDLFHPPNFGDSIAKYINDPVGVDLNKYHPEPRPSKEAEKMVADIISKFDDDHQFVARVFSPQTGDDHRRFIEYGGFLAAPPTGGSVEFRTEVEALKARWAQCDSRNPLDPYKTTFDSVISTAMQEWQAELAAQAKPRSDIVAAEAEAVKDLQVATDEMVTLVGDAWMMDALLTWKKFWLERKKRDPSAGPKDKNLWASVDARMSAMQVAASARVTNAEKAAGAAKAAVGRVNDAQVEAGKIADAAGAPQGRGLAYAQQSAQVAKATAAATEAAAKAAKTASDALSATGGDTRTLAALAETQTHALQAEYHRAAAVEAAAQAKAAAKGAAKQAEDARSQASKATAAKARAEAAEETARKAADDAREKRVTAEQEQKNAAKYRSEADAQRAKAAEADKRAQEQKERAASALNGAQAAGKTASEKSDAAEEAENKASLARDAAVAAERRKDSTASRAKALEAIAAAADGTADAKDARSAANDAKSEATQAADASAKARSAADDASAAAIGAREAATKAGGSAKRARAAADGAAADAAVTGAAVLTAHAAAAEAIEASEHAAGNVREAEKLAKKAAEAASTARKEATASRAEANQAQASSAEATGHAYATASAAAAARDSAAEVIKPANIAIGLGSPYREFDSSAGLAVLIGQTSKTLSQQQAAAAKAKADEAARAAKEARELAAKADKDAKVAAEAMANAAEDAGKAAQSLTDARTYATQAADAATAAQKADTNTQNYDMQARTDALTADAAAGGAEADAAAARRSATDAEKDAGSARKAADSADKDATNARDVASTADKDATSAEKYAENARDHAKEADQAATRTEEEERKALEADRKAAMEKGDSGASGGSGPDLSTGDEAILLAECGQKCVDRYRQARTSADASVIDWIKANGANVLLEVLGVNNAKRCFSSGDVESCLWTLVDALSLGVIITKIGPLSKAIITVSSRIAQFFDKAEEGKRLVTQFKNIVERVRRNPACRTVPSGTASTVVSKSSSVQASALGAISGARCDFIPGPIPDALEINRGSLVKIRDKQLEKALKTIDEDAHSFKEGYVGKGAISKFDAMRDDINRIVLVSKDGKVLVPTNVRYVP